MLKLLIPLFCFALIASCADGSKTSGLELGNFIKPTYTQKESFYKCNLIAGQTLNSVEKFIPKFIENFALLGDSSEELFFLFPILQSKLKTSSFELLLRHNNSDSLDKLDLTLSALSFDEIATCINPLTSNNSFKITNQSISNSPVVTEILECNYLDGFNYATMKLVLEQFTDAMIKNKFNVDLTYSDNPLDGSNFQWTNIFQSLDSRIEFVESWQALEVSKEIQRLLLEQSACKSSRLYSRYKVL